MGFQLGLCSDIGRILAMDTADDLMVRLHLLLLTAALRLALHVVAFFSDTRSRVVSTHVLHELSDEHSSSSASFSFSSEDLSREALCPCCGSSKGAALRFAPRNGRVTHINLHMYICICIYLYTHLLRYTTDVQLAVHVATATCLVQGLEPSPRSRYNRLQLCRVVHITG